jgi:hypothetical protein
MAGEETTNQGNIKVEYNTANVGLNMDNTPNQVPRGALTYALNASVENFDANSVNYQNEPGNDFCFQFPKGYVLIGEHSINEQNKHIFFLVNSETGKSEVGYMENNDCIYHTYINADCLNFNVNYPIHKAVHKITNCTTEIYWTDGLNSRRYLDLTNPPYKIKPGTDVCKNETIPDIDCNKLKIQPNFDIPQLDVVDVRTGGDLQAGTYQFAIQYCDSDGNGYTSYYSVTNPTPIADIQLTTPNFNYQVGKSIVLNVSNVDVTGYYKYYNIAVIKTINNITSVELVGTYFINNSADEVIYTGQNVTNIRLSTNDIFEKFPYYDIAQDLTSVQDVLVWDNLTSIDRINYQNIANSISLQWESWRIPETENYSEELNATNLRGYLRDEVYAFEIVFLLRNGKQTDGFHIPGRAKGFNELKPDVPDTNNDFIGIPERIDPSTGIGYSPYWKIYNTATVSGTSSQYTTERDYKGPYQYGEFAYWESTEVYPCNEEVWGELANQPIRHHKFPDVLVSPIFESKIFSSPLSMVMEENAVFPIGVKIDAQQIYSFIQASPNLTKEQKEDIVGFKIVRGDRGTNKSIVGKGILRNIGKYEREGTEYYFPNYPYNDVRKDPFLLDANNAYTANASVSGNTLCRSFNIYAAAKELVIVEYLDCFTNQLATKQIDNTDGTETKMIELCSLSFPKPNIIQGKGYITCNTYTRWAVKALSGGFNTIPANITLPGKQPGYSRSILTFPDIQLPYGTPPAPYATWVDYCLSGPGGAFLSGYGCVACKEVSYENVSKLCEGDQSRDCGYTYYFDSLIKPYWNGQGVSDAEITEVARYGYDTCIPKNLDAFVELNNKYRLVFNSPETSFGQPFLGDVLKLENVIFGAGEAHFVQVNNNASYKFLTREAQEDALASSSNIAGNENPSALFAAYQAYLTIYVNGITRRNYSWSFNSLLKYCYSEAIDNGLGIKQRQLDIAQYLIPGVQSVGDDLNINNWNRESSVYLKTVDKVKTLAKPYFTYTICNNNLIYTEKSLTFVYEDIVSGTKFITVGPESCDVVNSYTLPALVPLPPNTNYTIIPSEEKYTYYTGNTPALPFPSETDNLVASSGDPIIEDDTRFTLSESSRGADCNNPGKNIRTSSVVYYASLKNTFVNQWGQMYSYDTIDTGFQRNFDMLGSSSSFTVFGGDTFISRFGFKTKLPFFIDNRVGAPDDSDIFYDEIGNVAYPKYWHSSRSVLTNGTANNTQLTNFISIKAHNFDCPNNQEQFIGGFSNPGRTYYDGKMYQFAYGIPAFYCETSINTDLRQAFNNKEGDFWPHVSTSIPDDWFQEDNVTIAQDNTYYYNVTFSKQNKENFFSHLPIDWREQLCFTNFPFRAIYSDAQQSFSDNSINSWLIYRPVSFFDFPQSYGELVSLDGIQNRAVLARFDNKSLLYNTLLTVQTSNPQAAYLGNDTLFKSAPPIDFAETDLGYVGSQNKMLLKIPQGQITVDAKRGQVFLVSGNSATDLSAFGSGMNRWFTDHLAFEIYKHFPDVEKVVNGERIVIKGVDTDNHFTGAGLHGVFDSKYDRIILTKLDYVPLDKNIVYDPTDKNFYYEDPVAGGVIRTQIYLTDEEFFCNKSWTLSFNFNTKSWISFHSYLPNWYIAENNFFYSGLNSCCDNFTLEASLSVFAGSLQKGTTSKPIAPTSTIFTLPTNEFLPAELDCAMAGNAKIVYCEMEGNAYITVPPVPPPIPPTVCQRPTPQVYYDFVIQYDNTNTTESFDDACAASTYLNQCISGTPTIYSITGSSTSLSLGNIIYSGAGTSCDILSDGWYFIINIPTGQYNITGPDIYHIVGGEIVEIQTCECAEDIIPEPPIVVPQNIPECCGILFNTNNDIRTVSPNEPPFNNTPLVVPGFISSFGIANSTTKLWAINTKIDEWDIELAPFEATASRTITFPAGFTTSSGIAAINNTKLVAFNSTSSSIVELNITTTTATSTTKVSIPGKVVIGNMLYTTSNKLIAIIYNSAIPEYRFVQYNYTTASSEVDFVIPSTIGTPAALFECSCNIFVVSTDGNVYILDPISPYKLTYQYSLEYDVDGASQALSCINTTVNV